MVDGKGVGEASGGRGDFDGSEMIMKSSLELGDGDLERGAVLAVGVVGGIGKLMSKVDVVVEEPVAVGSELTKLRVELVVGNGQGGNVGEQVDWGRMEVSQVVVVGDGRCGWFARRWRWGRTGGGTGIGGHGGMVNQQRGD